MNVRLPVLLAALLLAGCASTGGVPVGGATYQDSVDFSRFQTFDLLPIPAGGARIAATLDYFAVEGVLARDLGGIGLARQMGGRPDLKVLVWRGIATDALVSPDAVDPAVRQMLQAWPAPRAR